jgi:glycosyltransferase involved in cell wall biosynthesis
MVSRAFKIVHATTVHPAFDARIFHRQCCSLASEGFAVTLIAQHSATETVNDVTVRGLRPTKNRLTRRTKTLWEAYRGILAEQPDLCHLHDPELIPVGFLLKFVHGLRVVYDMHEYHSEVIFHRYPRTVLWRLLRRICSLLLEAAPLRFFDAVVFPTTRLQQRFNLKGSSVVLLNLPSGCAEKETENRPSLQKKFDVVFVGAVSPPRMKFMLEVVKELQKLVPAFRWLFLGIPKPTEAWAKSNGEQTLLDQHVSFVPKVPHVQVQAYLRASRIGFNYHPEEARFLVAIPMKVFEYMKAGLPAVSTALPELEELLRGTDGARLIRSQLPRDYAFALAELINDPTVALELGKRASRVIKESLNWEKTEHPKLIRLYEGILSA